MNIDILKVGELETNCYIVYKNEKCLIIDPGAEENFIVSQIRKLELEPVAILITHDHYDHNTCALSISKIYNIPIYDYNNLFEQNHFIEPFAFNVIYTPGHSTSSICFYFEKYKIMFTGDFIFKDGVGRTDLPTGSYQELIDSIKKIKEYDDDIKLYPGHGETTDLGYEKENNEYFQL